MVIIETLSVDDIYTSSHKLSRACDMINEEILKADKWKRYIYI